MCLQFCSVVLCSVMLAQCGAVAKAFRRGDKWQGKKSTVIYDISALDTSVFPDGNPVGSLVLDQENSMMGLCTSFAISPFRILTNHHCIHNDEDNSYARPSQLTVIFKNRGDSEQTVVPITKIIDRDRAGEIKNYELYRWEKNTDWALLETSTDLSRFSPLEVQTTYIGADFFAQGPELTVPRINPPEETTSVTITKLDPVPASTDMKEYLSDEFINDNSTEKINKCKWALAWNDTAGRADCEKKAFTRKDAEALVEAATTYKMIGKIISGNSGSPLVYGGKVVGILHSGLYALGEDQEKETNEGLAQFFQHMGNKLDQ